MAWQLRAEHSFLSLSSSNQQRASVIYIVKGLELKLNFLLPICGESRTADLLAYCVYKIRNLSVS